MNPEYNEQWYEHNVFYFKHTQWTRTYIYWPHRCWLSQRWMWLKPVMHGKRIITGPGDPVVERYWVDEGEFFFHKLRYGY